MESNIDRAAKRNGASTLSPVRDDASRKCTSVREFQLVGCQLRMGEAIYHFQQPIYLLLPTPPLYPLLYRTYSRPRLSLDAGWLEHERLQATEKDL